MNDMNTKRALITGITGQDGSYLSELLLKKGYEVHGIVRRSSMFNRGRIEQLYLRENAEYKDRFHLHYGDLSDSSSLNRLLEKISPEEVYNLGAQSHVGISFDIPEYTGDVTGLGVVRMLEAIRETHIKTKFYQASSSELFGKALEIPQTESTRFNPQSPYACAKAYAFYTTKNYRESYNLFACNGILFNHESPRRGENFVTRKITLSLALIKSGLQDLLRLGNLNASRDWGFAGDYVEAMWLMLQQPDPEDYVISTGETRTVREFVDAASRIMGFDVCWEGSGPNERGFDRKSGKEIVHIDTSYFRPSEVDHLLGDSSKARQKLNWQPKTSFNQLVEMMVESDLTYVNNNKMSLMNKK
jgi:GDPmannose 4,6-dehydratase